MAIKLTAGDETRRVDTFLLNPFDIIVDEANRGRVIPPTDDQIKELALSMLQNGQIQPVECRRDTDSRPVLVLGFTRCAAARLIRTGFDTGEGLYAQAPDFKLKVNLVDNNDEAAFLRNIAENRDRNATSIIDDIHNWRKLSDMYGKTDAEIAALYKCSTTHISRNRKLLKLSRATQIQVHRGELTVAAALILADEVPEASHADVIEAVLHDKGAVTGAGITDHLRKLSRKAKAEAEQPDNNLPDAVLRDDPSKPKPTFTPKDKDRPVSMKEVKALASKLSADKVKMNRAIGKSFDAFLRGKKTINEVLQDLYEAGTGETE